jgi:hypothetical protein
MAKAKSGGGDWKGEVLQISILTSYMLGAFLFLICAILWLFIVPSRESRLVSQVGDWKSLAGLLDPQRRSKDSKEMWELRERFLDATKNPVTESLHAIVQKNLGDLQFNSFPRTTDRKNPKGGTVEFKQDIDLREAPLKEAIGLVARIQQENQGIQVGHIRLTRKVMRSAIAPAGAAAPAAEDDRWTSQMDFYAFGTVAPVTGAKAAAKTEAPAGEDDASKAEAGPVEEPAASAEAPTESKG